MHFTWHELKNRLNKKKHGISFETAALAFRDPLLLSVLDRRYSEERWCSIGRIGLLEGPIIFIAHTYQEQGHEEIIHIISTRKATAPERRRYQGKR